MTDLGRLRYVDPREVWTHEALDFTPWLLDNVDVLSEALGLDVEFDDREHPVGGFSLDIIGRDLTHDGPLIVENQLEATDHSHLGQLLTYAAGTDAATVVWIAVSFREEHRQAIDWLNENTGEGIRFFGIELQVARIGDSAPAPVLRIEAKPNDWQKQARAATRASQLSPRAKRYEEFWGRFLHVVQARHPDWTRARKPQASNWMDFPFPMSGTHISMSFARENRLRHELYIGSSDAGQNRAVFDALHALRPDIESGFGGDLEWDELSGRKASRIAEYRDGLIDYEQDWDEYVDWFIHSSERFRATFGVPAIMAAIDTAIREYGTGSGFEQQDG